MSGGLTGRTIIKDIVPANGPVEYYEPEIGVVVEFGSSVMVSEEIAKTLVKLVRPRFSLSNKEAIVVNVEVSRAYAIYCHDDLYFLVRGIWSWK